MVLSVGFIPSLSVEKTVFRPATKSFNFGLNREKIVSACDARSTIKLYI
jgi:hypothetical protein